MSLADPGIETYSNDTDTASSTATASSARSLAASAVGVSFASALNILLGFALQIALAALFGTSRDMDAFLAAMTIPNLFTIILFGALSITFVPVFVEYQIRGSEQDAWMVVGGFLIITTGALTAIAMLLAVFAEPVIALTVPGFAQDGAVFRLTLQLFYIMLPAIIFSGVGGLLRSVYHARRQYMVASWVPVINSLVLVLGTILLAPVLGVIAVAVSTLLGSLAQLLLLIPIMGRIFPLQIGVALHHPGVRRVLLLMLPWVAGAIFYKSNTLIDRFIASDLDVGTISSLGYAYRLMTAVSQVLTQGISMVLFPLMAAYVASGDLDRLRVVSTRGIRLTLLLALPVATFIAVARIPFVRLFFEYGRFDANSTAQTGVMLTAYLGAFVSGAIGSVLTYIFYARQETATVAVIGVSGFLINLGAALWLTPVMGGVAPAVAFSLAATWNLLIMTAILVWQLQSIDIRTIVLVAIRMAVACGVAGIVWVYGMQWIEPLHTAFSIIYIGAFGVVSAIGMIVYIGFCGLFGVDDVRIVFDLLMRRSRAKVSLSA
jgi:putative peptidoglycan lipid II flippase